MFSRKRWHIFTPGIVKHYRLSASVSYPTSLFETAFRNAFQWRWSEVLEVILTCFPPPRPSRAENVRLDGRLVSQTIPSVFVSSYCDIFNNQRHPAYSPAMSVFHYGMFEVKCTNNICIAVFFFQPALGKSCLFSFIVSIHRFWSVLQSALREVIRQL